MDKDISLHTTQGHHILHKIFPSNGPLPSLAHLWIHGLSLLLLALAMPMSLGRTLGHTHHDPDKQEHHKKAADRGDVSLPPMLGIHNFTERRQTKGRYARIIHAPTICLGQKWQRTQVGKKAILVHNEVRQHTSRGPGSFLFGGGWGC
jgi:hypothetical protein